MPIWRLAGTLEPNQWVRNASALVGSLFSMNTTDSPAAMLVMPFSATAAAGEPELSSIFQPVISTANGEEFVTSNQSKPIGLSPLDQGATSEMKMRPIVPGEPISEGLFSAAKAPLVPTLLSVVIAVLFRPAALLKLWNGPMVDAPKLMPTCLVPLASNRLTWSPPVLRPRPLPV